MYCGEYGEGLKKDCGIVIDGNGDESVENKLKCLRSFPLLT
jgi:hypothetical protein